MKMISREIKSCVTENRVENFDEVVKNYSKFYSVSQFNRIPKTVSEVDGDAQLKSEPKISIGYILLGVEENGDLTKLMSLIDSSD